PVIFICENNGWAVSVPTSESTSVPDIAIRAVGYGIPGVTVDGSNPDDTYDAVSTAAERARLGDGPTLIEIKNVRLLGHYATDPQDYRKDYKSDAQKDPLAKLRERLISSKILSTRNLKEIEDEVAI